MSFLKSSLVLSTVLALLPSLTRAQQSVSPAIDQARLFQRPPEAAVPAVNADGTALGETSNTPDDSFGAQLILKEQPRIPSFTLSGGSSFYATGNVALTRRDTREDLFAVVNAARGGIAGRRAGGDLPLRSVVCLGL